MTDTRRLDMALGAVCGLTDLLVRRAKDDLEGWAAPSYSPDRPVVSGGRGSTSVEAAVLDSYGLATYDQVASMLEQTVADLDRVVRRLDK